jgi:hypothetical protein
MSGRKEGISYLSYLTVAQLADLFFLMATGAFADDPSDDHPSVDGGAIHDPVSQSVGFTGIAWFSFEIQTQDYHGLRSVWM